MQENREQGTDTFVIEGRNAVLEAFRSGRSAPERPSTVCLSLTDVRTDR